MLNLKLITLEKKTVYTEGILIDDLSGRVICNTLEDPIRFPYADSELEHPEYKVPSQTAIPSGTFNLCLHRSKSLGKFTIMLLNVPNFSYILMHYGRTIENTSGCILCGKRSGPGLLVDIGMTDYLVSLFQSELSKGVIQILR
ncbi:MAG: DUF5675 family protein [Candidatus Paceibacterota bacterium]|jgi:hypothetical protein